MDMMVMKELDDEVKAQADQEVLEYIKEHFWDEIDAQIIRNLDALEKEEKRQKIYQRYAEKKLNPEFYGYEQTKGIKTKYDFGEYTGTITILPKEEKCQ